MTNVLFVCLGNICRSPMAEAIFRQKVIDNGLADQFQIESRATSRWEEGDPPHKGTRKLLSSKGIHCEDIRSEQMSISDFQTFDWIIGMDDQNKKDLLEMAPAGTAEKVYLLLEVLPEEPYREVPDPYYTGDFDLTFELVDKATSKWLEVVQSN
ncbi:low molecular weight phosphotyrosine protein phosphatase [Vagococcus sp. BWB3-3]|uniref:protein-tyrosine-phosphatase n=1 Tax=Vagococcus allomyrinae TaxID=2794353 RepID=A0A940P8R5_9ENTE|nr:low molecular weight protein-tyrosine-phosphatase [Vagococcus allomyrinae]MBP1043417.1 low molecular weight phosphotyrosine protein phosphatase [Vagococcus allomyrinae]